MDVIRIRCLDGEQFAVFFLLVMTYLSDPNTVPHLPSVINKINILFIYIFLIASSSLLGTSLHRAAVPSSLRA